MLLDFLRKILNLLTFYELLSCLTCIHFWAEIVYKWISRTRNY